MVFVSYLVDMKRYIFTKPLIHALDRGTRITHQEKGSLLTPETFVGCVLSDSDCLAVSLLLELGVTPQELQDIPQAVYTPFEGDNTHHSSVLDPQTSQIIATAVAISLFNKEKAVNTMHLLLAYLRSQPRENNFLSTLLMKHNITPELLWHFYKGKREDFDFEHPEYCPSDGSTETPNNGLDDDDDMMFEEENEMEEKFSNSTTKTQTHSTKASSDTPTLDQFGSDITEQAQKGLLDPMIGREREVERLIHILSRRKKNNPVLIGEPGVGKSAIVEGLAQRIADRNVNRTLIDKRIVSLDLALMVAGTKYRGQFEERIKAAIKELKEHPEIILFIDEIHTIIGAGATQGSMDTANILKPALARGEIQCIGATTTDEFRKTLEKDGALERRFQKIVVEPTNVEETIILLQQLKTKYEEYHNVQYTDEAVKAAVSLTDRYISDRFFPDKAIDAIDEAGASAHIKRTQDPPQIAEWEDKLRIAQQNKLSAVTSQNYELAASYHDEEQEIEKKIRNLQEEWQDEFKKHKAVVDVEDIARVVALMTGVPTERVAVVENEKLRSMAKVLKERVIGQDTAIEKLVKSIQRNRVGLRNEKRPIGSFLFLGSTGIGKTYLAQKLAEELFGNEQAMIRIDMSEYMEKFSVSRLVGAPPGYVGYDEGGQLTEQVRRHPYSVVLLDEIEKAHPDVYNILLQVLDEGRLTDSYGRQVDFKNTIIIITSNIGTRQLKEYGKGLGYRIENTLSMEESESILRKQLDKTFSPEFLNRLDNILYFEPLSEESILKIVELEVRTIQNKLLQKGITLSITHEALRFLGRKGYDPQYGARPIRRTLQEKIEDPITDMILEGTLDQQKEIKIDCIEDNLQIETTNY